MNWVICSSGFPVHRCFLADCPYLCVYCGENVNFSGSFFPGTGFYKQWKQKSDIVKIPTKRKEFCHEKNVCMCVCVCSWMHFSRIWTIDRHSSIRGRHWTCARAVWVKVDTHTQTHTNTHTQHTHTQTHNTHKHTHKHTHKFTHTQTPFFTWRDYTVALYWCSNSNCFPPLYSPIAVQTMSTRPGCLCCQGLVDKNEYLNFTPL